MYEIFATAVKYLFVTAIYFFMFSIIRVIYLDIHSSRMGTVHDDLPYIKLLNRRSDLLFRVEELYSVRDKMTLGRGAKADLTVQDPFLSAIHAQFLKTDDGWEILDNNSTNGTQVNGEAVSGEPCALKTGDLIQAGQLKFIFVEPAPEQD